jgi:hypothetical protein
VVKEAPGPFYGMALHKTFRKHSGNIPDVMKFYLKKIPMNEAGNLVGSTEPLVQ